MQKIKMMQNYQFLIKKQERTGLKHLDDSKVFIEYSIDLDAIYKNIEEYNPNKKHKILIFFDDMTAYMLSNKKLNTIVTELFVRGRMLNKHFSCFYCKILFCCSKKYQTKFYALLYYENSK